MTRPERRGSWFDRLAGTGDVAVPPHVFGITPERLSYAAFGNGDSCPQLVHEAEVPVSPSWFHEGVLGGPITDEAAFATALETLIGKLVESPRDASLVLPGEWLRTTYVEVDHVPKKSSELDEVVQWKLRQMVPFRVDDVRISYTRVRGIGGNGSDEGGRFLVGFAIDQFVRQLESAFESHGVRLGAIRPLTLTVLDALPIDDGFVLWASDRAVSLAARRNGEPVLLRYKRMSAAARGARERTVRTDLRLSRSWADEHTGGDLGVVRLAVPAEDRARFAAWCREDLGADDIAQLDLASSNLASGTEWRLAPLLGAVTGGAA